MNKIIKVLIVADVALVGGLGFVNPIFAIFLTDKIEGGNLEMVGYAAAIYWVIESLVVIPFGRYLDKNHGEKDDLLFIMLGSALAAISILGYVFARFPWQVYLLQAVTAVGIGMNIPGYTAIFTRHISQGKEAFNWSVRSALAGASAGVAGALGGIVATRFGFETLFIGVAAFIFFGSLLPLFIKKDVMPKTEHGINIIIAKDVSPKEQ